MKTLIEKIKNMENPIQKYVDAPPKDGRLPPQPNENMKMTKIVKRLLGLK